VLLARGKVAASSGPIKAALDGNRAICAKFPSGCTLASFLVSFGPMHLRMPSIDQGVQAFAWAVFFFVFLWVGMLSIGVSGATAFIVSLLAGAAIFVFVRVRGEDRPGERVGP
jgi:hypothetical protein